MPPPSVEPASSTGKNKAEDDKTASARPDGDKAKDKDATPTAQSAEPAKTEPAKTEPAKTEPAKTEPARTESKPGSPTPAKAAATADTSSIMVRVVPGITRYHKDDCLLIRFLAEDDLEVMSLKSANDEGYFACKACKPDQVTADAAS